MTNDPDTLKPQAGEIVVSRLAAIVESSDDAIIGKDLNGIVTSWNRGAENIFGYTSAEMVGNSIRRLIPTDRQEEEDYILGKIRRGEKVDRYETLRQTKNGRLIHVSVTSSPIKDAAGKIVGASKIARDITARKAHEQEVARLSRLYAALSQINQAIVWTRHRDELFEKICRVLVELGQFSLAWIGMPEADTRQVRPVAHCGDKTNYLSQSVIYADDRPEGRGPMGTAIRKGEKYICNDFTQDAVTAPWHELANLAGFRAAAAFPIRQDGKVVGGIMVYSEESGFFRDMEVALLEEAAGDVSFALDYLAQGEQRGRAETALRESVRFNRATLDALGTHVAVLDEQGNILTTNAAWREFALKNAADLNAVSEGANYLTVCETAAAGGNRDAAQVLIGIHAVANGTQPVWFFEYACNSPSEQRWFNCRFTRFPGEGPVRVVVAHENITERKLAEQSMRETEERYRGLFDRSLDCVFLHDFAGKFLDANHAALDLFGYQREDIATLTFAALLSEDQLPLAFQVMEEIKATGRQQHPAEYRLRGKDGRQIYVETQSSLIYRDGQPVAIQGIARDLTERKAGEERLRRANRALQMLSRCNEALIRAVEEQALLSAICRIAVDIGGYRMGWVGYAQDDAARSITPIAQAGDDSGYLSEIKLSWDETHPAGQGVAGQSIRSGQIVVLDDTEQETGFFNPEAAQKRGYRGAICLPLRDAKRVFGILCLYTIGSVQTNAEEFKLLQELADDLAFGIVHLRSERERQQAEAAHARLATAVEQAAESILITDPYGVILYVNPAFEKISGYTLAEVLGRNPRLLRSGAHDAEFYRRMWQVLNRGEVWRGQMVNVSKDGKPYEVECSLSPVRASSGEIVNYVAVQRDVSREKQLEAQFRQAQKMEAFGQLAGGVAHDFNNILAVIQLQAGILKSESNSSSKQLEFAGDIEKAAQRGANLTRQLLLFSRQQVMQARNLKLKGLVDNMARMLQRTLGEQIKLQFKFSEEPIVVHADAGMIDQILLNLTVNARDAMPNGGQIIIETSTAEFNEITAAQTNKARPGSFACLSVSDTGGGIPPEILPRIFEPFFSTKDVGKGTGLGLATVFGIVQQHQGWINVYSEVGRGTVFRVYLPRQNKTSDTSFFKPLQPSMRGGSETILLVEDEAPLRATLRTALSRLGYQVLEAANGQEALEVWRQHRAEIRLLLTDMVMPDGMNGKELAEQLLQQNPDLKVIFASGYSREIAGNDLHLEDGVNFLAKPFELHKLSQALRVNLGRPAQPQA